MKRKKVISIFLLLGIIVSQVPNAQILAAKKKKVEIYRLDYYAIQSKKQYTIRDVINIKRKPDSYNKSEKKKFTNPKIKWKSRSRQIQIKKNRFKVKKSGTYELTGILKGKKKDSEFTIVLRVYDKLPEAIPEKVSKITISRWENAVTIILPEEISLFRQKFNYARYRLDVNTSNCMYTGWAYWIKAYSDEEELVCDFTIDDSRLIRVFWGGVYRSTANSTIKEYAEELFNKYYVPEAKED